MGFEVGAGPASQLTCAKEQGGAGMYDWILSEKGFSLAVVFAPIVLDC
jgi:hypothetical protein